LNEANRSKHDGVRVTTGAARSPSPSARWWILFAIGIGNFMSALDGSVVNTILPVLRRSFNSDIATIEWVVTVYLLTLSGLLLGFGRLGDLRGHKSVYLTGFVFFLLGSGLCGLAPSVGTLIAFRAFQALGAAMLSANSPALLTRNFPSNERGRALGVQAMMTYLGLTVGPSLGGWAATALGWRSVFYINVPVALFAIIMSARLIPADSGHGQSEPFDFAGALLFLAGLVSLMLGLNIGHDWGWTSAPVLGLLAAACLLLALFIAVELRRASPMLDLHLFRHPTFRAAVICAILNYICIYGIVFLVPFYLIQGRGLTAAGAGLILTAQPLVMAVVAPISGSISDRVGARLPGALGLAVMAIGLLMLGRLGPASSTAAVAWAMAVTGLGTGIFISPNSSALLGSAARDRQGIASAILGTARNFGMVLGVGLAGAVFTTLLAGAPQDVASPALFAAFGPSFYMLAGISALGALVAASQPG
jgi:EmrB/QacA subfamily drug resistance transporter